MTALDPSIEASIDVLQQPQGFCRMLMARIDYFDPQNKPSKVEAYRLAAENSALHCTIKRLQTDNTIWRTRYGELEQSYTDLYTRTEVLRSDNTKLRAERLGAPKFHGDRS